MKGCNPRSPHYPKHHFHCIERKLPVAGKNQLVETVHCCWCGVKK